MDDVWKDITTLSALPDTPLPLHHHHRNPPTTTLRSVILQDFFSRASDSSTLYGDSATVTSPPPPASGSYRRPATALSLNSSPEFCRFLDHQNSKPIKTNLNHFPLANDGDDFDVLTNPSSSSSYHVLGSFGAGSKKRFSEGETKAAPVDRRHMRMIKNRESAARSRARKQAYINELELEVAHLVEENAKLRKQQQQQLLLQVTPTTTAAATNTYAAAAASSASASARNHRQKRALQRSSTAPF